MEIKLFGKNLFSFSKDNGGMPLLVAEERLSKAEYLPDFHTNSSHSQSFGDVISIADWSVTNVTAGSAVVDTNTRNKTDKPAPKKAEKSRPTPKRLYQLKALNDNGFELKTDPIHVDEQIENFKTKLALYKDKSSDYRGANEISSILIRLENRKKYPKFNKFYEQFPYTTGDRVTRLLKQHDHLKLGEVSQFLADMPKEATQVMKEYTEQTKQLCDKKPIFYIIAKKADFERTQKRRDPILLVQSPFAHMWQILGAWDEEMLLIEEL